MSSIREGAAGDESEAGCFPGRHYLFYAGRQSAAAQISGRADTRFAAEYIYQR